MFLATTQASRADFIKSSVNMKKITTESRLPARRLPYVRSSWQDLTTVNLRCCHSSHRETSRQRIFFGRNSTLRGSIQFFLHCMSHTGKVFAGKTLKSGKADQRFWQAGGKVAGFLDSLYRCAFAPMSGTQRKKVSVARERTFERRFCFIKDEATLHSLSEGLEPKEFFCTP